MNSKIDSSLARREFLTLLAASLSSACSQDFPPERYSEADADQLMQQRTGELARHGLSPFGVRRYQGYQGLAKLPWFELNSESELVCIEESFPAAIDVHCHLGMSVLLAPALKLQQSSTRVRHLLDCDDLPSCGLDLDLYANGNFDDAALKRLRREIRAQGLMGSQYAATQTIPNLINEMNNMRVQQAFILPIKLGLWFGDDLTEQWRSAVGIAGQEQRLLTGFSIHPRDSDRLTQLEAYAQQGFKLLKLHPTVQRFYPDDPDMNDVYELAQQLNVKIFFHGGRAGIEPATSQPYALPRHYQRVFRDFPRLQCLIGHAGARDFSAMLELCKQYENVWIGSHGQSLSNLDLLLEQTNADRVLFGTDWPFYHIGMSLAKILLATDTPARRTLRNRILRDNALEFLAA